MSPTILVMEDDAVLRELLCEVLREEGYQVVAAASMAHLLEIMPPTPQLLITDLLVNLEVSGLAVIDQVRKRTHARLPVLVCSAAKKQIEELQPELDRRAARVLAKPFTIDELIDVVERSLDRAKPASISPALIPALI